MSNAMYTHTGDLNSRLALSDTPTYVCDESSKAYGFHAINDIIMKLFAIIKINYCIIFTYLSHTP